MASRRSLRYLHDVEDRREGLRAAPARLRRHLDQRRPHVIGAPDDASPSTRSPPTDLAAELRASSSAACMLLEGALVDQRPDAASPCSQRIADPDRGIDRFSRATSLSWMLSWTNSRRSVVQRWPAVPMAAKAMARSARSRSADGQTIARVVAAELQDASRPKRCATPRPDFRGPSRSSRSPRRAAPAGHRPAPRRHRAPPISTVDRPSAARPSHCAPRRARTAPAPPAPSAASSPTASRSRGRRRPAPAPRSTTTPRRES